MVMMKEQINGNGEIREIAAADRHQLPKCLHSWPVGWAQLRWRSLRTRLIVARAWMIHKNILQHQAAALMRPQAPSHTCLCARTRLHTRTSTPMPWPHREESDQLAFHREIQMERTADVM